MDKNFELKIKDAVLAKMAQNVIEGIEGVAGLSPQPKGIKEFIIRDECAQSIFINCENEVMYMDVYISVYRGVDVNSVAKDVQYTLKNKLEAMTSNVIDNVNVIVDDYV